MTKKIINVNLPVRSEERLYFIGDWFLIANIPHVLAAINPYEIGLISVEDGGRWSKGVWNETHPLGVSLDWLEKNLCPSNTLTPIREIQIEITV